jgi:hypothetical protein
MNLKVEALLLAMASLITLGFLWSSSPYLMGAFVFIAQPLFLVVGSLYIRKVFRDLRGKRIL